MEYKNTKDRTKQTQIIGLEYFKQNPTGWHDKC